MGFGSCNDCVRAIIKWLCILVASILFLKKIRIFASLCKCLKAWWLCKRLKKCRNDAPQPLPPRVGGREAGNVKNVKTKLSGKSYVNVNNLRKEESHDNEKSTQ